MAERNRDHIVIPDRARSEPFRIPGGGGGSDRVFTGDRGIHGRRLQQELETAYDVIEGDEVTDGTYLSFRSFPGFELAFESLESMRSGEQPELLAVKEENVLGEKVWTATVFIPDGKKRFFFERLTAYLETVESESPKNANLLEGIQSIQRATIRELWTDSPTAFPEDPTATIWWEVWLRKSDGRERQRFDDFAEGRELKTSDHYLDFGERTVVLLEATADELAEALALLDDIAELRGPREVATFLARLPAHEQVEWTDEIMDRIQTAPQGAPAVCILDTGIQAGHPLLVDSLADPQDLHVADPRWNVPPTHGHGTEMAGLALFESLEQVVLTGETVQLSHGLESVKFLPDHGVNDPDLYAAVTARSIDRPEIQFPDRQRVFMLAVTASSPDVAQTEGSDAEEEIFEPGKPTSWSASVDALAYGRAIDDTDPKLSYLDRDEPRKPRLFVVSAGNISDPRPEDNHLDRCDVEPVEDPGQAWNAVTVGAFSSKDDVLAAEETFQGYSPVAPQGELSAVSRTSVSFDWKRWPFKPEVVADGGNHAVAPDRTHIDTPDNLSLLTTRMQQFGAGGHFTVTRDTSAATAQVAAIAARIQASYPNLRPETVRALVVHSAEWTEPMRRRFDAARHSRQSTVALLRRYGMGVPAAERALKSSSDALTLVAESTIRPYAREGNRNLGAAREMNLHELPWPSAELETLGDTEVRMRVTLSYFVEPNPSSRGWNGRYTYPSYGLRFAVKRPDVGLEEFRQRVNLKARTPGTDPPRMNTETGWVLGADQQKAPGSLHTDIWTGTAAALAGKGAISIYPVGGWWKYRKAFDQSAEGVPYSLIVSIEAPDVEVDLWSVVAQQIQTATAVTV